MLSITSPAVSEFAWTTERNRSFVLVKFHCSLPDMTRGWLVMNP